MSCGQYLELTEAQKSKIQVTKRPGSLREERFVLYYLDHDQGMGKNEALVFSVADIEQFPQEIARYLPRRGAPTSPTGIPYE